MSDYIGDSWLVKIGDTIVPPDYIMADTYTGTINTEEYAERDGNRDLHRDVIARKPSVKWTVESKREPEFTWFMNLIKSNIVEGKDYERKIPVTCWIPEELAHVSFDAYVPDIQYMVRRIDNGVRVYGSFDIDLVSY